MNKKNSQRLLYVLGHLLLGFLVHEFSFIATYYGLIIVLFGTYYILGKPDPLEQYPLFFAAYVVGIEVLLRMAGSALFWEFGKYAVIYFLLLGILRRSKKINIYLPIAMYFILLLPAIYFIPFNSFNSWRQDLTFNLSGPAVLAFCSIYLYKRTINKETFGNILFCIILPIISIAIYNILSMPDLRTYHFMPYSDSYTSGGYGPNQVATIFGFGITAVIAAKVLQLNLTSSKYIDFLILVVFFVLGTITFSRGGIFAAIISITCSISFYFFHDQKKIYMISKSIGIIIISVIVWIAIVSVTDGVIMERYGFVESGFGEKMVLDLTGRVKIYKIDLNIFYDHFFTGVGPGQATELRELYGYGKQVIAHTEYSRMLAEHGILGLFSLLMLIGISINHLLLSCPTKSKFIKILFGFLAVLTLSHSAMRLAMPSFIYGFLFINYKD